MVCSGYAYLYLWKENKTDNEHKEAWYDPRAPKTQKNEDKFKLSTILDKNRVKKL